MPIDRKANDIVVGSYATRVILVPENNAFNSRPDLFGTPPSWPQGLDHGMTPGKNFAFIPTFQRGIQWSVKDHAVPLFLNVNGSGVIGTTTWGCFTWAEQPYVSAMPPGGVPNEVIFLTDGLQRFAALTALMAGLDHHGYMPGGAKEKLAPSLQRTISLAELEIIRFNHNVLLAYARSTLAAQYEEFRKEIDVWVDTQGISVISQIETFLTHSQIGVDIYRGFGSSAELAKNFITLNTGRVELGNADICRAEICADGEGGQPRWTAAETLEFDTSFNNVFIDSDRASRLEPLVNQLQVTLDAVKRQPHIERCAPLPSFNTQQSAALKLETDEMLERLGSYTDPKSDIYKSSQISEEVLRCGKLPISLLAAFNLLQPAPGVGNAPWYLDTPIVEPVADLLVFLRSIYRLYLANLEARQTPVLLGLLDGSRTAFSLRSLAQELSMEATSKTKGIDDPLDSHLLKQQLAAVTQTRAARVFNACELPPAFQGGALIKQPSRVFKPSTFGTNNAELQIDHLIPQKGAKAANGPFCDTIHNFAPIPKKLNTTCGTHACSIKLQGSVPNPAEFYSLAAGTYKPVNHKSAPAAVPHPYVEWLVNVQGVQTSTNDLDNIGQLSGTVGNARIDWLVKRLVERV